jgi:hypothetical protein
MLRDVCSASVLLRVTLTRTSVWTGYLIYRILRTNSYNSVTDFHNLESLHTNIFSLSALVLTG